MPEATCCGCSAVFVPVLPEQAWCSLCRMAGADEAVADFRQWAWEYMSRHGEDVAHPDRAPNPPGPIPHFGL